MTEFNHEENVGNETRNDTYGVRVRKTTQNQNLPESQTRPVSSPSNDSLKNIVSDKLTNTYHKFYSQQPPNVKTWVKISAGLIFVYLLSLLLPSAPPSPFFHKFAHETNQVFEKINSVDLPASNSIMKHTVSCRNAANMVQHSPAFEKHGSQIASGLREFGEKIMTAGRNLQNMYNKGSSVYKTFDIEIEAMMDRLNSPHMRQGNAKFFKERLNKLTSRIQEFRRHVEKAQSSVQDAEEIRHDTEGYIHDGLREAEKFIKINVPKSQQAQSVVDVDIAKAEKELMFVNNLLDHLTNTAVFLDKIRKILANYEDKLLDVESELGDVNNEESLFEVTREDLKYLKLAITNLQSSHDKFLKLSD